MTFIEEIQNYQDSATPNMADVMQQAVDSKLYDLKVCLPAQVLRYDHQKQLIDCQPVLKKKYNDGTVVDMPKIYNVPVAFPRAGDSIITMPLKKNHYVMLVFCDRSLDKWLSNGGKIDPGDVRKHHLSDAIALPGLYPFNEAAEIANADDIIIKNKYNSGRTEIRVKRNGHLQILNHKGYDLIKLLDEMLTTLREAVVYAGDAGAQPLRHSNFSNLQAKIKTFVES